MSVFKRMVRGLMCIVLSFCICLLTGCSALDMTTDSFISPPRTSGEMRDIEQALKKSVNGAYTLKYPTAGDYRSAYIMVDLMDDGVKNFAVAFYSMVGSDNVVTMHLNLMKKTDDRWVSVSDISVAAVGVEKLVLSDLNGDGTKEMIVGWNVYAGLDKKVAAYTLQGATLNSLVQEQYTNFICCDLMGDGRDELFVINHDVDNAVASARFFAFDKGNISQVGSCNIDGAVTSFNEPTLNMLSSGTPAIFIDAFKGTGMQTEIVYYKDKESGLVAPLYQAGMVGLSPTYRSSTVACMDINSDGYLDIPIIEPIYNFDLGPEHSTLNHMTRWCMYNGSDFSVSLFAVMNYTDGYYFEVPQKWQDRITVSMSVESRLRTVNLWNVEDGSFVSELLKVRAVSETEWDQPNNGFYGYKELGRSDGIVYIVMISNYSGDEAMKYDEFKELFHIIG